VIVQIVRDRLDALLPELLDRLLAREEKERARRVGTSLPPAPATPLGRAAERPHRLRAARLRARTFAELIAYIAAPARHVSLRIGDVFQAIRSVSKWWDGGRAGAARFGQFSPPVPFATRAF
jgi:hypothetical protein